MAQKEQRSPRPEETTAGSRDVPAGARLPTAQHQVRVVTMGIDACRALRLSSV